MSAEAIWFKGPREVEQRAEDVPAPGEGEVRVEALFSAISQGTEMLVYRGQVSPELALDLPTLRGSFGFPIKYGYACVGRVVDVGPGATSHRPGDTVFVHHPHQTAFVVPAASAIALPAGVPALLGVFTANVETAVNVVLDTPLRFGETAVVFGQGTVGLLAAQLLKQAGAGCVLAVEPVASRRELSRQVGIEHLLAPEPRLAGVVRELTGGRGADVAIEASGAPAALQQAIDCVADEGTVVAVSWFGAKPVPLLLGERFHRGRLRLRSSQVGHVDPALAPRWDRDRRLALALSLLPRLRLEELISHRLPFAAAAAGYRLLDEHPDQVSQLVLTYG